MIGFGILFIGLDFIKDAVPNISDNPEMFAFLDRYTDFGIFSTLLFVLVGTVLTLLTQSSSAATAITLVIAGAGLDYLPYCSGDGTTVKILAPHGLTANIAAIVGNVHAKRAARFHFFFNVIGVIWMLLILTPFLHLVDNIIASFSQIDYSVLTDTSDEGRATATPPGTLLVSHLVQRVQCDPDVCVRAAHYPVLLNTYSPTGVGPMTSSAWNTSVQGSCRLPSFPSLRRVRNLACLPAWLKKCTTVSPDYFSKKRNAAIGF